MNKRIAIGLAMAMTTTAAHAATITAGATGLWSASGTWTGGVVPGTVVAGADVVRVGSSYTVTLNSSVAQPLGTLQIGRASIGTLIVNSGASANLGANNLQVGEANNGSGTFTMNGGSVSGKDMNVGNGANGANPASLAAIHGGSINLTGNITVGKAASASLTMDGGSVLANKLQLGDSGNLFNGSATLTGGTVELASGGSSLTFNTASTLTMGNTGVLIWGGNRVAAIDAFVIASDIVWSSGSSTLGDIYGLGDQTWTNGAYFLHADYDATDLKTRVWADTIPEPATIGMIGLGALITLLVRRLGSR